MQEKYKEDALPAVIRSPSRVKSPSRGHRYSVANGSIAVTTWPVIWRYGPLLFAFVRLVSCPSPWLKPHFVRPYPRSPRACKLCTVNLCARERRE